MKLKTLVIKYCLAIRKHYLVILVEVSLNMNYTKKACRCGY